MVDIVLSGVYVPLMGSAAMYTRLIYRADYDRGAEYCKMQIFMA